MRVVPEKISKTERYKRVCERIDLFERRNQEIFSKFIQLNVAIIGGFAWLKTQKEAKTIEYLLYYVRFIAPIIAIIVSVEMILDMIGWWGYRKSLIRN